MLRTVTSITTHVTAEGTRLSITYSEISDTGEIVKSNERVNRIVVDEELQGLIDGVNAHAQIMIDSL